MELSDNKHKPEGDEKQVVSRKLSKFSDDLKEVDMAFLIPFQYEGNDQNRSAVMPDHSDSLIPQLGRDMSISCLLRLSRSDYGSIASLNQTFRSLIRSGELYQLRRKMGIVEYWIYFFCDILECDAFDLNRGRWMHVPRMASNQTFISIDKESLAVGTELLIFGRERMTRVVYRYSILTNSWSPGIEMNVPRRLFASASLGGIAIVAGGFDGRSKILSAVELYNSNTKTWETLPNMNKARKMCSGVFMDGKFYVLAGIGEDHTKHLTCGEEFDLKTRKWREIPNMFPPQTRQVGATERIVITEAPPLVAVVNNVLYAANYSQWEVRRYVKERNKWVTIGSLPEGATSLNGWGLEFRACGNQLVVIGLGGSAFEIHSWIPDEGAPHWNLLARRQSRGYVYNSIVMGC